MHAHVALGGTLQHKQTLFLFLSEIPLDYVHYVEIKEMYR